jgi:hypothetical protein
MTGDIVPTKTPKIATMSFCKIPWHRRVASKKTRRPNRERRPLAKAQFLSSPLHFAQANQDQQSDIHDCND